MTLQDQSALFALKLLGCEIQDVNYWAYDYIYTTNGVTEPARNVFTSVSELYEAVEKNNTPVPRIIWLNLTHTGPPAV